jgi:hypothetical protein
LLVSACLLSEAHPVNAMSISKVFIFLAVLIAFLGTSFVGGLTNRIRGGWLYALHF